MAVHYQDHGPGGSRPRCYDSALQCVDESIRAIAHGRGHAFILGERGTGKDIAARRIHDLSFRKHGPFVRVSLPELTESFVEHELFGGAPEGPRPGRVHEAAGGTLFLEDVTGFSRATQTRLSRFLAGDEASADEMPDVRVIAASAQPLEPLVEAGLVSSSLFELLQVLAVRIPPLRERKAEVLGLAHEFLAHFASELNRPVHRFTAAAIGRIVAYDWPGNVKELELAVEHAVTVCDADAADVAHLPRAVVDTSDGSGDEHDSLQATLGNVERALIENALRVSLGNQAKAAQLLGITERLMGLRVKKYDIDPRAFRKPLE